MINKEIKKQINNQAQGGVMKSYVNKLIVCCLCVAGMLFADNRSMTEAEIVQLQVKSDPNDTGLSNGELKYTMGNRDNLLSESFDTGLGLLFNAPDVAGNNWGWSSYGATSGSGSSWSGYYSVDLNTSVSIPAGATDVILSYYSKGYDCSWGGTQQLTILDEGGSIAELNGSALCTDGTWVPFSHDLTSYQGQTVTLNFGLVSAYESGYKIDEVLITYTPAGAVQGCTDSNACNYNSAATSDDGSCVPKDCAGQCDAIDTQATGPNTEDDCGVCDSDSANDNTTCTQDCAGIWGGTTTLDGSSCGCATPDGGSVVTSYGGLGTWASVTADPNGFGATVVITQDATSDAPPYQYMVIDNGTCTGYGVNSSGGSFFALPATLSLNAGETLRWRGADAAGYVTYASYGFAYLSSTLIELNDPSIVGCIDSEACNYDSTAGTADDSCVYADASACETCVDGVASVTADADGDGVCDADEVTGCTNEGDCNQTDVLTADHDESLCTGVPTGCETCGGAVDAVYECTEDPNYDDGSFWGSNCDYYTSYPSECGYSDTNEACCACGGGTNTLVSDAILDSPQDGDADDDGVCDVDEIEGCQDAAACNYNENATDEGSCNIAGACDSCNDDGTVNAGGGLVGCESCSEGAVVDNDADDDGVCDADEIVGCQTEGACNYDENATDSGSCNIPATCDSCSDDGSVINGDENENDVCDVDEVDGCDGVLGSGLVNDDCGQCGGLNANVDCAGTCSGSLSDGTWINANPGTSNTSIAAQGSDWTLSECALFSSVDTPIEVEGVSLLSISAVYGPCDYTSSVKNGTVYVTTQTTHFLDFTFASYDASFTVDGGTNFYFTSAAQVTGEDENGSVTGIVDGGTLGGLVADDCGECGGSGPNSVTGCCADGLGANGESQDCNGDCGGSASLDECGDCAGGNSGAEACSQDECGVWGGSGADSSTGCCDNAVAEVSSCSDTDNGAVDAFGYSCEANGDTCYNGNYDDSDFDELAMCCACGGGENIVTTPGVDATGPNGEIQDCNGDCGGSASLDDCGDCAGGNTGNDACAQDECGVWGGSGVDANSCCDNGTPGQDAVYECTEDPNYDDGSFWGSNCDYYTSYPSECGYSDTNEACCACGGGTNTLVSEAVPAVPSTGPNGEAQDCAGICGGDTYVSNCGICNGEDNTPSQGTCDCEGTPDGTTVNDCWGECGGDGFSVGTTCSEDPDWTDGFDGCSYYSTWPSECGYADSNDACCACGGGTVSDVCANPALDPIADLNAEASDTEDHGPNVLLTWGDLNSDTETGVTYTIYSFREDGYDNAGGADVCNDCTFNYTANGADCCDSAWDAYGLTCANLEANYNWDCSGCGCPGDVLSNEDDNQISNEEIKDRFPVDESFIAEALNLLDNMPESPVNRLFTDYSTESDFVINYDSNGIPVIDISQIQDMEIRGGFAKIASGLPGEYAAGTRLTGMGYGSLQRYVITSVNNTGQESGLSNEASATTPILSAPTNLVAAANYENETISLSWDYPGYESNPYPQCTGDLDRIGDGFCDSSTNVPECGYDGGDCCAASCDATLDTYSGCTECTDCGRQADDGWDSCYDPNNGGSGMPTCNDDYAFAVVARDCYKFTSALEISWNAGCDIKIYKNGEGTTIGSLNPPVINYGFEENQAVDYAAYTCKDSPNSDGSAWLENGTTSGTCDAWAANGWFGPYGDSYFNDAGISANEGCCNSIANNGAGGGVLTLIGEESQVTTSTDCDAGVENCAGDLSYFGNGACDDDLSGDECLNDGGDCADGPATTCSYDYSANNGLGLPYCDDLYNYNSIYTCAYLETNFGWNCNGCACPGDQPVDDSCTETPDSNGATCSDYVGQLGCETMQRYYGYDCQCACADECYSETLNGSDYNADGFANCEDYLGLSVDTTGDGVDDFTYDCAYFDSYGIQCCGCDDWDDDGVASLGNNDNIYHSTYDNSVSSGSMIASSDLEKESMNSNSNGPRVTEGFKVFVVDNDSGLSQLLGTTTLGTTFTVTNVDQGCFAVTAYDTSPAYESELSNVACVEAEACPVDGDSNGDGNVNVADVVSLVNSILNDNGNVGSNLCGDVDGDGTITVSDIVSVVNIILGRKEVDATSDASEAKIIIDDNRIVVEADGMVQGLQMKLSHEDNFSIKLVDAYVANYVTNENITSLVIVTDGSTSINDIATFEGENVKIESSYAVNGSASEVSIDNIEVVANFELKLAGPNPFNPTTSLNVVVPEAGLVSVNVYNVLGQQVATLANGYMDASSTGHTLTWNAENLASGVYFVRANASGEVSTQKLMLLK